MSPLKPKTSSERTDHSSVYRKRAAIAGLLALSILGVEGYAIKRSKDKLLESEARVKVDDLLSHERSNRMSSIDVRNSSGTCWQEYHLGEAGMETVRVRQYCSETDQSDEDGALWINIKNDSKSKTNPKPVPIDLQEITF